MIQSNEIDAHYTSINLIMRKPDHATLASLWMGRTYFFRASPHIDEIVGTIEERPDLFPLHADVAHILHEIGEKSDVLEPVEIEIPAAVVVAPANQGVHLSAGSIADLIEPVLVFYVRAEVVVEDPLVHGCPVDILFMAGSAVFALLQRFSGDDNLPPLQGG